MRGKKQKQTEHKTFSFFPQDISSFLRRVPISRMAPQPGQEVAVERVVEVDRERKEELILAKQL